MATSKPTSKTTRPRSRKSKAPALKTVQRKIGDETHPWSSELGGIPQKFGPPAEDSADDGAAVIVSQPTPHAPVDGKVPALELTAIGKSIGENAEKSQ